MPQVPVKLVTSTNHVLHRLRELMKTVHDEVRERAFRVFQDRGCEAGHELEDWLEAERDVLFFPRCILAETEDQIRITASVPGFGARTLQVDVLPDAITIEGKVEGSERRLLRQLALPARVDPDDVQATIDGGVLRIAARKTAIRRTTNARCAAA
jgi:HSP20 family molecular chaperone IbpA